MTIGICMHEPTQWLSFTVWTKGAAWSSIQHLEGRKTHELIEIVNVMHTGSLLFPSSG